MTGRADTPPGPPIDPTANVAALVKAETRRLDDLRAAQDLLAAASVQRQDDLRLSQDDHVAEQINHVAELLKVHSAHAEDLRAAEAKRIDAIRAVDVAAVTRATEVAAVQATTLASQVAASAEAMRVNVAAAQSAAAQALAAALEPIQRSIDDLRRAQYEAQGVKAQSTESGIGSRAWIAIAVVAVVGFLGLIVSAAGVVVAVVLANK